MDGSTRITEGIKDILAQSGEGASIDFLVVSLGWLPLSIWKTLPYEKQVDTVKRRLIYLKKQGKVTEVYTVWNNKRYFRLRRDDDYDSYIPLKEPPKTFS